jgi:hypothetical protein
MKVAIFKIFLLLIISNSFGQTVEISCGANRNNYFDLQRENGHFITEYNPDFGFSFGLSISDFKIDTLPMRISLLIDNYKGGFYTTNSGLGGGNTTEAKVNKTTLGIGIYPLNVSIRNNFHFSFGGEVGLKLFDQTSGYKSSWRMGTPITYPYTYTYMTIENDSVKINKNLVFGISGRISYDIRIKENWYINPQYKFYFGLTDEFENTEAKIKSMRHSFLIGIIRKLK